MQAAARALGVVPSFDPAQVTGSFCVATSDHVDAVWLEPLRARLEKKAPGVEVLLAPYSSEVPRRALEGDIDLVIAPRTRFVSALQVVHFVDEPYALVHRADHPRARGRIDLEALADLPHLVVSPTGDSGATSFDRALGTAGKRRRVTRRVTSFASGLLIVATSDLIAILPRSFAALHAERLGLRVRPLPIEVPPARLDLAWSPRLHDDPLHTFVRRELGALTGRGRAPKPPP
jgi:DNA-binding transcriptional LysR family regulator